MMSRVGKRQSLKILEMALDLGVRYFDTADSYGFGESEMLLGRLSRQHPGCCFVSTKGGTSYSPKLRRLQFLKPIVRSVMNRFGGLKQVVSSAIQSQTTYGVFDVTYLRRALEGSLRRLRRDNIDLYLLHNPSAEVVKRGEVFAFLDRARDEGKIRAYGVSCGNVGEGLAALDFPGLSALQVEVNWREMSAMEELIPRAAKQGVSVIARGPFAAGRIFESDFVPPVSIPPELNPKERRQFLARAAVQSVANLNGVSVVLGTMMSPAHLEANVSAVRELKPEIRRAGTC